MGAFCSDKSSFDRVLLQLALVIHKGLNDDDDEIRDVASECASPIIFGSQPNQRHLVPVAASKELTRYLAVRFHDSSALCTKAVEQMTDTKLFGGALAPTASQRFRTSTKAETALFLVEKQNLYMDSAREAILWCQVLKKLTRQATIPKVAAQLATWVLDGLETLTQSAHSTVDGTLSLSSKPDVFNFGLQVLYGADVLLHWRSTTKRVHVAGHVLRLALYQFLQDGEKSHLHPLWLELAEKVLARSVLKRLANVKRVLGRIEVSCAASESGSGNTHHAF